jgi:hypothetical protein
MDPLRLPLDDADRSALKPLIRPLRNSPKWLWGIGIVFAIASPVALYATDAPIELLIGTPLGFLAVCGVLAMIGMGRLKKIDADLASGHKIEVSGLLEARVMVARNQSGNFRWRIHGQEYVLDRKSWHKAKDGQQVRLSFLESSRLVFRAEAIS